MVLPPVGAFGSPNHQAADKNAQRDTAYDGRNWIPSLVLCQLVGPTEENAARKQKWPGLRACKSGASNRIRGR
jgi:hypothetical protein